MSSSLMGLVGLLNVTEPQGLLTVTEPGSRFVCVGIFFVDVTMPCCIGFGPRELESRLATGLPGTLKTPDGSVLAVSGRATTFPWVAYDGMAWHGMCDFRCRSNPVVDSTFLLPLGLNWSLTAALSFLKFFSTAICCRAASFGSIPSGFCL